jgi:hypothetical protein
MRSRRAVRSLQLLRDSLPPDEPVLRMHADEALSRAIVLQRLVLQRAVSRKRK